MNPVKCFTELEKDLLVKDYDSQLYTKSELANMWECSRRTINRVLEERGVSAPTPEINMSKVKQFLKQRSTTDIAKLFCALSMSKITSLIKPSNVSKEETARH